MASVQGYAALVKRLEALGEEQPVLRAIQLDAVAQAKLLVHRKTGHLGRSIVPGVLTATHAQVEARTPYAAFVELGTRPHIIRPVKAKVLAWGGTRRLSGALARGSSPTHFARIVHHPGTRPYPYLIPGAQKAVGKLRDAVVRVWNSAA